MATFDQLAPDQRAIIELILRQGKSYGEIGGMLDLPAARVRELARDALAELAPYTAERVEGQWRGQLADYVLGQQSGPEATATRGHMKRSEPARIWAFSLLDALDDFYTDGDRPQIPAGGDRPPRARRGAAAIADGEEVAEAAIAGSPLARRAGALASPVRDAVLRRRILAGVAGLAVVVAILLLTGVIGGGDDKKAKGGAQPAAQTSGSGQQAGGQGNVVAQAVLAPIGSGNTGQGAALVYQSGKQAVVVVRAKVPPSLKAKKYVLWLYNSEKDLVPLAADFTDKSGNFQGAAALPANYTSYRFIDLTFQPTEGKNVKHGMSVLRGPLTQPTQGAAGGATGPSGTP
jgi:hypothetical protein